MNSNGTELEQIARTYRTFVPERLSRSLLLKIYCHVNVSIGHYRVQKALTFKTRLSAKPSLFKLFLFIESFRFWDENEIFSVLSTARAWTNVILAGESDDRRDSTTSFDENVVVAETSYQIIEVSSSFCDRERAKPFPIKITALIFPVRNSTMNLSRLTIFRNIVVVVVLIFKSKTL